ncbi:MAG: secretion protein HlyD [Chlorobi bacterium]|nr:secretion protein HlyD [Chlorobiota bacterium]
MNMHRITTCLLPLIFSVALVACSSRKDTGGIEASGMIETTDVTVSARAAGNITRIRINEGDHVHAGDTLIVVDDTDLRLQRDQLKAAADVAGAGYDLARHGSRPEDIAQSDEAVSQAKANLDNAEDDQRRYAELLHVGSISTKDYENVKTKYQIALRQYKAAQIGSDKLRHGSRTEDITAARARREQADAQIAAIDKKISDCVILAPIEGVVTRRGVEMGEFVNVGSGVMTISQTETVKLKIYVAEDELGKVKLGEPADIVIDTYKDKHYRGKVTYISPTAEFTPKNVQTKDDRVKLVFEVQIAVPNAAQDLKSGMTADAKLLESGSVAGGK